MASRTPNEFRTGVDPGESGVRVWIDRWAEDSSDIDIRKFEIHCPRATELSAVLHDPLLLAARRSRDSALHCFLKYLGALWLHSDAINGVARYEAQAYFPNPENLQLAAQYKVHVPPRSRTARILTARDRNMNATHGCIIAIDVLGKNISIEVGATQPYNLLTPMLEGLVKRAVWIPFPRGVDRSQFTVDASSLKSVIAYEFTETDGQ
jgi:hypothetical protein